MFELEEHFALPRDEYGHNNRREGGLRKVEECVRSTFLQWRS